jgi:hypothetical protein
MDMPDLAIVRASWACVEYTQDWLVIMALVHYVTGCTDSNSLKVTVLLATDRGSPSSIATSKVDVC